MIIAQRYFLTGLIAITLCACSWFGENDREKEWISLLPSDETWLCKIVDTTDQDWRKACFSEVGWNGAVDQIKDVKGNSKICLQIPIDKRLIETDRVIFKKEFWRSEFVVFLNEKQLLDTHGKEYFALGEVESNNDNLGIHPFYKYQSYNIDIALCKDLLDSNRNILTVVFDGVGPLKAKDRLTSTMLIAHGEFDDQSFSDEVSTITPKCFLSKSDLPLLFIDTRDQRLGLDDRIVASLKTVDRASGYNWYADTNYSYSGEVEMKLRGHLSLTLPKKQFLLKTLNSEGRKENVDLLGLPSGSKWVLNGTQMDFSIFRNQLGYEIFNDLGHYSPRSRFCELIINGNYQGVYVITEKIEIDTNRLDLGNEITNTDDDSGGWLLEIDRSDQDQELLYTTALNDDSFRRYTFTYKDPKYEKLTKKKRLSIAYKIDQFETALLNQDNYLELIDTNSFIDFIILNEISKNMDGYRLSTYVHCYSEEKGGKLAMGPMWDFDMGFGLRENGGEISEGMIYDAQNKWYVGFWWSHLMEDPEFNELFKRRYAKLRRTELSLARIHKRIDDYSKLLEGPQKRNFAKWNLMRVHFRHRAFTPSTYEEEVEYIKEWLDGRINWLDSQWILQKSA